MTIEIKLAQKYLYNRALCVIINGRILQSIDVVRKNNGYSIVKCSKILFSAESKPKLIEMVRKRIEKVGYL